MLRIAATHEDSNNIVTTTIHWILWTINIPMTLMMMLTINRSVAANNDNTTTTITIITINIMTILNTITKTVFHCLG